MTKKKVKYKSTRLPEPLFDEIEKLIEETKLYTSSSEFIKDAIRKRIEELHYYLKHK